MKKIFLTAIGLLTGILCFAQTTSQNYIKTYSARQEITTTLKGNNNKDQVQQSVQYVDGLGRPIQSIVRWGSPDGASPKDMVSFMTYDKYGRQLQQYLPYRSDYSDLRFDVTPLPEQNAFYDQHFGNTTAGDFAFAETEVEPSPLNRAKKQGAPGQTWQVSGNHTADLNYRNNNTADAVRRIYIANNKLIADADYASNLLTVSISTDENNGAAEGETIQFTDRFGRVILKKVKASNNYLKTYYVYDDYGNLRYVVPPAAVEEIENNNIHNNRA